jgi:hypothetical protein
MFWRLTEEQGICRTHEIKEKPLVKILLQTSGIFILELEYQIYIWVGNLSRNTIESSNLMLLGKGFIKHHKKPFSTQI